MSGRIQVLHLPNGRFVLVLDGMPPIGHEDGTTPSPAQADWATARQRLLEHTGAVVVLRFDHPVDVTDIGGAPVATCRE